MSNKTGKRKDKVKYSILNNIIFLLRDMARIYPLLVVYIVMQATLSVISPILGIYLPKLAVDLVVTGADTARIFYVLGGFAIVMAVSMALNGMACLAGFYLCVMFC